MLRYAQDDKRTIKMQLGHDNQFMRKNRFMNRIGFRGEAQGKS
jgi:hypothetical protein